MTAHWSCTARIRPSRPLDGANARLQIECKECGSPLLLLHTRSWKYWAITPIGGALVLMAIIGLSVIVTNECERLRVLDTADRDLAAVGVPELVRARVIHGIQVPEDSSTSLSSSQKVAVERAVSAILQADHGAWQPARESARRDAAAAFHFSLAKADVPFDALKALADKQDTSSSSDENLSAAQRDALREARCAMRAREIAFANSVVHGGRVAIAMNSPLLLVLAALVLGICFAGVGDRLGDRHELICPRCLSCLRGSRLSHFLVVSEARDLRSRRSEIARELVDARSRTGRAREIEELRDIARRDMNQAEWRIREKCFQYTIVESPYLDISEQHESLGKFIRAVTGGSERRLRARIEVVTGLWKHALVLEDADFQRNLATYMIAYYMTSSRRWGIWLSGARSEPDWNTAWTFIDVQDMGMAMLYISCSKRIDEFETRLEAIAKPVRADEKQWDIATAVSRITSGLSLLDEILAERA